MQDQIASLSTAVQSLTQSDGSPGGGRTSVVGAAGAPGLLPTQRAIRHVSTAREAPFQGPTTSAFSFDLAKSNLQRRGIVERTEVGEEGDLTQEPSPLASPSAPHRDLEVRQAVDPLWSLPKTEALRLCQVYEEEMGIMYPVLELSELLDQVNLLYGMMDDTIERETQPHERSSLDREDVYILRLVFACALTAEASGRSEQAIALFDSVREVQDNCVWGPPEIKSIIFLTLVVRHSEGECWYSCTDFYTVNILLSNGRRNTGLADHRDCGAHVFRERSSSPGDFEPTSNRRSGKGPSAPAILVHLHSRHALELWNGNAVCPRGLRY